MRSIPKGLHSLSALAGGGCGSGEASLLPSLFSCPSLSFPALYFGPTRSACWGAGLCTPCGQSGFSLPVGDKAFTGDSAEREESGWPVLGLLTSLLERVCFALCLPQSPGQKAREKGVINKKGGKRNSRFSKGALVFLHLPKLWLFQLAQGVVLVPWWCPTPAVFGSLPSW